MERLWATDSFIDDNTLTVNVARLRKTLEDLGLPDFITTKRTWDIWWSNMTKREKLAEFARREARRHLGAAALLALCSGTYALVGWLAGAPLPALAYGGLLCLCAALAVLGWDARCAWQRCCELERLAANLPASIAELPPPPGPSRRPSRNCCEGLRRRTPRWRAKTPPAAAR